MIYMTWNLTCRIC